MSGAWFVLDCISRKVRTRRVTTTRSMVSIRASIRANGIGRYQEERTVAEKAKPAAKKKAAPAKKKAAPAKKKAK
jgi:hypothetical protein